MFNSVFFLNVGNAETNLKKKKNSFTPRRQIQSFENKSFLKLNTYSAKTARKTSVGLENARNVAKKTLKCLESTSPSVETTKALTNFCKVPAFKTRSFFVSHCK